MQRIVLRIIGVRWFHGRNLEWDYYAYPAYLWRYGSARAPAVPVRGFPRSGDKRFGGWSC